jgi:ABC-type nitrate/sulfonate/bicarbonate transport system substrate-binding protein
LQDPVAAQTCVRLYAVVIPQPENSSARQQNESAGAMSAAQPIHRRSALKGLAGAALIATGGASLVSSACSQSGNRTDVTKQLPVRILSSQGNQVLTIESLVKIKGFYNEFGLAATATSISSGTNIVGALIANQADICIFAGFSGLILAVEKGAQLKILAGASIRGQQAVFSKNPAVQHVKDLEGRTFGVGAIGAQLHQVAVALLRKKGVDVGKVKFVNVGSSGDVFRAVAAGVVDAGNGQADVLSSLDRFGVHMVQDGDYAVDLPEYTWQASFAPIATIQQKRETLVRTLAAYCKAFRYVQNPGSKDDFVRAQLDALGEKNRDEVIAGAVSQWEYLQKRKIYAEDLILSEERVQYMQELNMKISGQKKIIPYNELIDTSLAKEAVARLG